MVSVRSELLWLKKQGWGGRGVLVPRGILVPPRSSDTLKILRWLKKKKRPVSLTQVSVPFPTHYSGRGTENQSKVAICLRSLKTRTSRSSPGGQVPRLEELGATRLGWGRVGAQAGPRMVFIPDPPPDSQPSSSESHMGLQERVVRD